ncbi:MAG: arginine--tRNA ligase [Candidatus Moranbacteria bacterium CG23_combo_of_CG06-09_8_20_14_all_35_22]|nr:MAG: arginine--tRNA ligase [Candidatus Moranbacteria bacterium CG23_combo_of_CG06-09_8_20_14_all_35_22]
MKNKIRKLIKKAVKDLGYEIGEVEVDYPKVENFGDYTTNVAMVLARLDSRRQSLVDARRVKIAKKNPMEIAESIKNKVESIKQNEIEKVEVVKPGYINFYLSKEYLQDKVQEINKLENKFGESEKKKEKIMVEYSQPNTHKEFHIGHLRNVFIGNSLVNILKKAKNNVISANYIGDTGTHIAKCLWGITKFYSDENLDSIKNKAEFLGKVYSQAVKAISENPEYENEFKNLQKKFEAGDKKLIEIWEKTKEWSLDEFQEIYKNLGVDFEVYFWESEEEKSGKKMLPELLKYEFIKESQGAIIADLEKYNLGILVLVRKDGSVLYGLKDVPLAIKKFKEYKIDKSIVVVDIRQGLYFKQIFKILELIGFEKEMKHIEYEFVSLKGNETMSSRKGNIIPAKFLMEKIIEKVREKFPQTKIEKEIGLGALKFFMLKYSAQTNIEFDMDEAIRLDGATGPYVQYAYARICSILEKVKGNPLLSGVPDILSQRERRNKVDLSLLTHEKELNLIRELNKFPELIEEISKSYEVHKLPYYAIKLADKFHSFYNDCKVIDEENLELTSARLNLINAVRIVLGEALRLMGVNSPNKM